MFIEACGEEVATQAAAIDIIDNSAPKEWKTIGTGVYTDMYILPLFGKRDCSWELQVQQNTEDPTLFRYVHPPAVAFAMSSPMFIEACAYVTSVGAVSTPSYLMDMS